MPTALIVIIIIAVILGLINRNGLLNRASSHGRTRRAKQVSKFRQDYNNYGGNPDKVYAGIRKKPLSKKSLSYDNSSVDSMEGHDFEYFCADILQKNGFNNVEVTKGSGDYGIDILAKKDNTSYAIQCKRYQGNVGNKAVQEALSGKMFYGCDSAIVLTNSFFTKQAKETARRTAVTLWDRDTLMAMIKTANPNDAAYSGSAQTSNYSNNAAGNSVFHKLSGPIGWLIPIIIAIFVIAGGLWFLSTLNKEETLKQEENKAEIVSTTNNDENPPLTLIDQEN